MSLKTQLSTLKAESLSKRPVEIKKTMSDDLENLRNSGIIERAPKTGEKLKNFTLLNQLGQEKSLSVFRKRGPVIVTFYRGGWCPYCNLELRSYQKILPQIEAAGATLVAITPELPDASLTTSEKHGLEFEVLTDTNSDYAQEIGIVFTLADELRPIYEGFGIAIEKHNGKGQFNLPLAATFVVDVDGTIAYSVIEADYTLRAEPSDVVAVLQSLIKGKGCS